MYKKRVSFMFHLLNMVEGFSHEIYIPVDSLSLASY